MQNLVDSRHSNQVEKQLILDLTMNVQSLLLILISGQDVFQASFRLFFKVVEVLLNGIICQALANNRLDLAFVRLNLHCVRIKDLDAVRLGSDARRKQAAHIDKGALKQRLSLFFELGLNFLTIKVTE